MSPELAAARQTWYDNLKPGMLVIYNEWSAGFTNKPAIVISINNVIERSIPSNRPIHRKRYVILVNEVTRNVHQDLISPLDGWSSLIQK